MILLRFTLGTVNCCKLLIFTDFLFFFAQGSELHVHDITDIYIIVLLVLRNTDNHFSESRKFLNEKNTKNVVKKFSYCI